MFKEKRNFETQEIVNKNISETMCNHIDLYHKKNDLLDDIYYLKDNLKDLGLLLEYTDRVFRKTYWSLTTFLGEVIFIVRGKHFYLCNKNEDSITQKAIVTLFEQTILLSDLIIATKEEKENNSTCFYDELNVIKSALKDLGYYKKHKFVVTNNIFDEIVNGETQFYTNNRYDFHIGDTVVLSRTKENKYGAIDITAEVESINYIDELPNYINKDMIRLNLKNINIKCAEEKKEKE